MSINQFVEMTIFLCLICFSIYDKMQGFIDESGLFIFLLIYYLFIFFILCRNSRWPPKVAGKRFLRKVASRLCRYPVGQIALSRSVSKINAFLCLTQKFKMAAKSGGKMFFFCDKMPVGSADTLRVKNFVEIAPSCSVSEINTFLYFTQKFKMAAKSSRKMIFEESCQQTLQIPCGSKILSKLLYLSPFPR